MNRSSIYWTDDDLDDLKSMAEYLWNCNDGSCDEYAKTARMLKKIIKRLERKGKDS